MKKPNIRLRALTRLDLEHTLAWNNQAEISNLYSGHPFPINKEMETQWYDKILSSNFPTTVFGIETIAGSELIGISILKDIHMINRCAEFAIYIGDEKARGKGYSREATEETLKFGFTKLGLCRISLKVLENNPVAIKLYKSIGFIEEGKLRSSAFKNDVFLSEYLFGILKEEFNGRV